MKRELLEQPFAPEQIKQRAGNFGQTLSYIEGWAVIQRLNDAFDGKWSFQIESHEVLESEVIVRGNLTADDISKSQFGSSTVTRAKNSGEIISLADDLKAAATDALKKCATLFGVGLHIYSCKASHSQTIPTATRTSTVIPEPTQGIAPNKHRFMPRHNYPDTGVGSSGNEQVNNGRLSQKQHSFLQHLADDRGISRRDLDEMSRERFSCVVSYLSKGDASSLIREMTAN